MGRLLQREKFEVPLSLSFFLSSFLSLSLFLTLFPSLSPYLSFPLSCGFCLDWVSADVTNVFANCNF